MTRTIKYVLKLWLSTIVVAPIFLMLLTALTSSNLDSGAFGFILFAIIYGLVMSLPSLIVIYLILILAKKIENTGKVKGALILSAIILANLTLFIVFGRNYYQLSGNHAALTFSLIYSSCLAAFGMFYSIKPKQPHCT